MNCRPICLLCAVAACLWLAGCAAPQARLGGRVMYDGEPVERARVELLDAAGEPVLGTFTDADGVYDLYPAPAGSYRVRAAREGDAPLVAAWGAVEVALTPERDGWTGLQLVPWEGVVQEPYAPATPGFGALSGVALFRGAPVAGAVANLYLDRDEGLKGPGFRQAFATGAGGAFAFEDLPEGDYWLALRVRKTGPAGPVREGDLYGLAAANPIAVKPDREATVRVHLVRKEKTRAPHAAALARTGTAIAGVVVDEQGAPVAGVYVFAYRDRTIGHKMPDFLSEPTGGDGTFVLPLGAGGLFYVGAREHFGGSPRPGEWFGHYEGSPDHGIRVETGKRVEGVSIPVHKVLEP